MRRRSPNIRWELGIQRLCARYYGEEACRSVHAATSRDKDRVGACAPRCNHGATVCVDRREVNQPTGAAVTNPHAAERWLGATPPNIDVVRQFQPPGGERRANLSGPQHDQDRRVGNGPVDLPLDCRGAPRTIAGCSERGQTPFSPCPCIQSDRALRTLAFPATLRLA